MGAALVSVPASQNRRPDQYQLQYWRIKIRLALVIYIKVDAIVDTRCEPVLCMRMDNDLHVSVNGKMEFIYTGSV
jgi:hypothetical protein